MLMYELINDGTAYSVLGETDNTVSKIEIPDMYEGLPVTEVSAMFSDFENLKEIYIGNNVVKTGFYTFDSPSIEKIYFGKSIKNIGGPFNILENLTDIYYSGTETDWGKVNFLLTDEFDTLEKINSAEKHYGVLAHSVVLKFGEDTLMPFTHWDCVKGKPDTISAEKISYTNEVSGLNADNIKDAIDELNAKHFDVTSLNSWNELQHLVRSGRAKDFLKIGDRLVSQKNDKELVWDVIGIDEDTPTDSNFKHSLTLQLSECYTNIPFSRSEASYCDLFHDLPAGQYFIGLRFYTKPTVYFSFALDEDLPAGNKLRICENTVYLYNNESEEPYKSFAVTSSSETKEEMSGTELEKANDYLSSAMGTVNYEKSYIRKWLNTDSEEIKIYNNIYELKIVEEYLRTGFKNGMDEDFLNAVNAVKKVTYMPDGSKVETNDKFFLLSLEEVYGKEGTAYSYYKENSSRTSPGIGADTSRVKNYLNNPRYWWLRTPAENDEGWLRVHPSGGISSIKSTSLLSYGIVPACCIC